MPFPPDDPTLESNAYAIAYRLLGDRPVAHAVAGIAAQRLRQDDGSTGRNWLYLLVEFTLAQTVGPAAMGVREVGEDEYVGLRAALRRRLERATSDERVAGALTHLCGYPVDFVAEVLQRTPQEATALAGVLAPPPGVHYRDLGDSELTKRTPASATPSRRMRRPHWTTIAAVTAVVAAIIAATQVTGPRPTLGPPPEEGGLAVVVPSGPPPGDRGPSAERGPAHPADQGVTHA